MKKDLKRIIELPTGVNANFEGNTLTIKGESKQVKREFDLNKIKLKIDGQKIVLSCINSTRRESKNIGTFWAHIKNMIKGACEDFSYTLEICHAHFPMNVKTEGNKVIIKSFLGETTKRTASIIGDAKVEIKGAKITVTSANIEAAGQTAANIEKATRLKGRDRRIFQDGIYIIEKNGRAI